MIAILQSINSWRIHPSDPHCDEITPACCPSALHHRPLHTILVTNHLFPVVSLAPASSSAYLPISHLLVTSSSFSLLRYLALSFKLRLPRRLSTDSTDLSRHLTSDLYHNHHNVPHYFSAPFNHPHNLHHVLARRLVWRQQQRKDVRRVEGGDREAAPAAGHAAEARGAHGEADFRTGRYC